MKDIYSRFLQACRFTTAVFKKKHLMKPGPDFSLTVLLVSKLPHICFFSDGVCVFVVFFVLLLFFSRRNMSPQIVFRGKPSSEEELYSGCL